MVDEFPVSPPALFFVGSAETTVGFRVSQIVDGRWCFLFSGEWPRVGFSSCGEDR